MNNVREVSLFPPDIRHSSILNITSCLCRLSWTETSQRSQPQLQQAGEAGGRGVGRPRDQVRTNSPADTGRGKDTGLPSRGKLKLCQLQDEKNQIITTNLWLNWVGRRSKILNSLIRTEPRGVIILSPLISHFLFIKTFPWKYYFCLRKVV